MKPVFLIAALALSAPFVLRAQQSTPMPELSLTANGGQDVSLYGGWPLIVHATIMNSSRFAQNGPASPLVIAPNGAAWTSAVSFTAVDTSGQAHQWPLNLIGTPADPALTLAPTSYVRFTLQMAPADVSSLTPGTYQLTATFQVSNSNAWNGAVQSRLVTIRVGPEPALTAQQQSRKALLIAEYQMNAGDANGALSTVEQLIQSQPSNTSALTAAANLLELMGYPGLALFQTREAINAYFQANPSFYDPPANLLAMNQRLFTQAITANSSVSPTTTSASGAEVTFSPADQTVRLSATISATSGSVDGGTVTFAITGAGNPVTSSPVTQGNASVLFTIPGGTKAGNYPIAATYNGTPIFLGSNNSASVLKIDKATPVITWSPPASVPAGTALSSTQLNASANAPGTFIYNPPAGTILASGTAQTLNVTFTPTDSTDYGSASASVSLTVLAGSFSGSVSPTAATVRVGNSKSFSVTITSSNFVGAVTLSCVQPPAGISCQFAPSQVSLGANASSTTVLTVSVKTKPAALAPRSSPSWRLGQFMVATALMICILPFVYFIATRHGRENPHLGRQSPAFPYALVFLSLLSVYLVSCSGLPGGSGGGFGRGGGSSPSSASLVVQGTSGMTAVRLGTVSITVP